VFLRSRVCDDMRHGNKTKNCFTQFARHFSVFMKRKNINLIVIIQLNREKCFYQLYKSQYLRSPPIRHFHCFILSPDSFKKSHCFILTLTALKTAISRIHYTTTSHSTDFFISSTKNETRKYTVYHDAIV
jgi:hypothetical protein